MPTNVRDPRSFITPDAFELDPALLGTPLARPGQRLTALIIDLIVIGLLNVFTSGLGLFIWGTVAVFLVGMAFRRPSHRMSQMTGWLFRGATGCLGMFILLLVVLIGGVSRLTDSEELTQEVGEVVAGAALGALGGGEFRDALREAETREEAEAAVEALVGWARGNEDLDAGSADDLEALLPVLLGDDPAFTDDPEAFVQEMVRRFGGDMPGQDAPDDAPAAGQDADEVQARVAELTLQEVVGRYETVLAGEEAVDPAEVAALQARIVREIPLDTVSRLQSALAAEQDRTRDARATLQTVEEALDEQSSGFVGLLSDIWDQAGSVIGIWSIYFTVTLTLFRGFTLGKRSLGIRVVRLDGQPITWWAALERAGGYVAGIATGTLGFVQIFWDRNRQCVHDKIGGTVVVIAGAAPDADALSSAWTDVKTPAA